jgi:exosortase
MTHRRVAVFRPATRTFLLTLAGAMGVFVWAYWTTLGRTAGRWAQDPLYSHGYLVPAFALGLLWLRRGHLADADTSPSWWGLPLLAAGLALRFVGTYFYLVWVDEVSIVPCVAGVFVAAGGRRAWDWAWPALAFLLFMVPLPYRLSVAMTGPLQQLATVCSTFCLQALGLPALADGTVIRLNEVEINIVEACSGLRMLVIFFALSTAVALVIRRPAWQKAAVVVSAVPIALVVNVLRITVTGILHETVGSEAANAVFHDLAGWLMMPAALLLLALELKWLAHLFVNDPAAGPRPSGPARRTPPPLGPVRRKWQPVGAGAKRNP